MGKRVILRDCMLSFPRLIEPDSFEGQEPKYSAVFVFSKEQGEEIERVMAEVAKEAWPKDLKKLAALKAQNRTPLKDGDLSAREEYAGKMYMRASSKTPPMLVDGQRQPVDNPAAYFYPGAIVNAAVDIAAIGAHGKASQFGARIVAYLVAVQFVAPGERLGQSPEEAVEAFPVLGL